jgi:hypothetical protein
VEITVSLIGLFYCISSYIAGRAIFQSIFLDGALQAINEISTNPNTPSALAPNRPKPQWGSIWWVDSTMVIGLGAVSALVQWDWAPGFFIWGALWQALYFYWLAPKFWDHPETFNKSGRQQSKRAFYIYLLATAFIYYCGQQNILTGWSDLSWGQQGILVGLSLVGGYWFTSNAWRMREMLTGKLLREKNSSETTDRSNVDADSDTEKDWNSDTEPGFNSGDLIPEKIVVRLIEGEGFFFDAQTGKVVDDPFTLLALPFSVEQLFEDWENQWATLKDPTDPTRSRINGTDDQKQSVNAAGQKAYDALQTHLVTEPTACNLETILKPERFALAPFNEPQLPKERPVAIKLMLEYLSYPLWHDISTKSNLPASTEMAVGCFSADECGLSWKLSREIEQWAEGFNESWDYSDPAKGSQWTEQEINQANQIGIELVEKIRFELTATNRANVPVRFEKLSLP